MDWLHPILDLIKAKELLDLIEMTYIFGPFTLFLVTKHLKSESCIVK